MQSSKLATVEEFDQARALALVQDIHDHNESRSEAARSESTRRGYAHWQARYSEWCSSSPLRTAGGHVEAVRGFLLALEESGLTLNSIRAARVAISVGYTDAELDPNPAGALAVRKTMKAITNRLGSIPPNRKLALKLDNLRSYLEADDDGTLRSLRDRAVLVTGFALASRRSELVALDASHLEADTAGTGYVVTIERSKTDQAARGMTKHLPRGSHPLTDPAGTLTAWMTAIGIRQGQRVPLFRPIDQYGNVLDRRLSGWAVSEITKRAALALNLDPACFGAHSLRRGFISTAAEGGVNVHAIRRQSGHSSLAVLVAYVEQSRPDLNNAVGMVGL